VVFTDRMLDMVTEEFRGVEILRFSDFDQMKRHVAANREMVKLVVFDETLVRSLDLDRFIAAKRFPLAATALAYMSPEVARHVLTSLGPDVSGIGFLPMKAPLDAWLAALRLLTLGETYVPSELLEHGPSVAPAPPQTQVYVSTDDQPNRQGPSEPDQEWDDASLTPREQEILTLVAQGERNRSIATSLGLSEHTVKLHVHHIFGKIGVSNRTSATHWYMSRKAAAVADQRRLS